MLNAFHFKTVPSEGISSKTLIMDRRGLYDFCVAVFPHKGPLFIRHESK